MYTSSHLVFELFRNNLKHMGQGLILEGLVACQRGHIVESIHESYKLFFQEDA